MAYQASLPEPPGGVFRGAFLRCALIGVLALLSASCGDRGRPGVRAITQAGAGEAGAKRQAGPRVALIVKSLVNPFFRSMEQGARRAEREEGLDLQVRAPTLETMVDQEIQLVEDEIQAHAAAIVIAPADSMRLVPVLKKAQDAGIPVINVDNRLSGEAMAAVGMKPPPFVGVDNEKGAFLVAKYAADHVHGPTQAAVLEGIRAANNAVLRKRGAERGLATNKAVRIVAEETANWNIEEAYARSKSIFRAHPGVGLIFCANDVMAFGVLKYLEESGRTNVVVVGFDALDEAKTAIRAHRMLATVDQQADVQGYLSIQAALRLVRGEPVPPETWADVKLVTLETLP